MYKIFSLLLEFGLEESILATNEKACTGGAQFLKLTNKTLNLRSESDRSENTAMQHEFSILRLEYTKNLKCCVAD
ncbi:hypothetical protein [Leptospira noguchii]|uniref:hypothetical protein n=1 Tax=Leptospira noguchii TaxID=28182 RepID=UPI0007741C3A|nr:hypothetical protein [Leptospira noguchii]